MHPETFLELVVAELRQAAPGVAPEYVDAFVQRHRKALLAQIELAFAPVPERSTPTAWGGRMGAEIDPATLKKGMRLVCEQGHGSVDDVTVFRMRTIALYSGQETQPEERHYSVNVHLDSGRVVYAREFHEELARGVMVPDVQLGPHERLRSPAEAWQAVVATKRSIETAIEKANNARLPNKRREWIAEAETRKAGLIRVWDAFAAWRRVYHDVPVEGLDPFAYRLVELAVAEARRPDPLIGQERSLMASAPPSWRTRYAAGDQVDVYRFVDGAWTRSEGWAVVDVDAAQLAATVSDGPRSLVVPLWLLRSTRAVPEVNVNASARPSSWWTAKPASGGPEGCIDKTIPVPGYGDVRVVCGQAGRRDVWHNVWVRGTRFGYNGGRWAKSLRPADAVLEAIRSQGITAFG